MLRPVVFMFSGQGSQYYQMGRDLYESGGVFADWMNYLDALLFEKFDFSVLTLLYGSRAIADRLVDTAVSHPAIFMVETALAFELIDRGIQPDISLGVSVGSFAAAAVAGHLRVEDALTLVVSQADILRRCCGKGGMVSILANTRLYENESLRTHSVIAAHNLESHFVISAREESLSVIETNLTSQGVAFQSLPVEFAYHSPWIEGARSKFECAASAIPKHSGRIPLMCCSRAEVLRELPVGFFWQAIRDPILFNKAIAKLEEKGAFAYVDAGPSGTLATLLKYLLPSKGKSTIHRTIAPFSSTRDNIADLCRSRRSLNDSA